VSGETGKPLDAPALLEFLERHRVQYVVVGGYAAELHGSVRRNVDVDVVPRTTADNLERLAAALREVQAKIRIEGFPEVCRSPSREAMVGIIMLNLVTKHASST
jgi:molybdenum cofactor biosynthesis enzyme MoaA